VKPESHSATRQSKTPQPSPLQHDTTASRCPESLTILSSASERTGAWLGDADCQQRISDCWPPYDHRVMAFEVCNMKKLRLRQPRDDSSAQPLTPSPRFSQAWTHDYARPRKVRVRAVLVSA